jgi:hypothetical protein
VRRSPRSAVVSTTPTGAVATSITPSNYPRTVAERIEPGQDSLSSSGPLPDNLFCCLLLPTSFGTSQVGAGPGSTFPEPSRPSRFLRRHSDQAANSRVHLTLV